MQLAERSREFEKLGARVYGLAVAPREALVRLQEELGDGVALLADPEGLVAKRYGVLLEGGRRARAATFLVNPEGRIWGNWFPDSYRKRPAPDELLAAIR